MKKNPPHYAAMLEESKRLRWPQRFRTDLTLRDRDALANRDPSAPFGWVLACWGTVLIFPSAGLIDLKHRAEDMPGIVIDTYGEDDCRFYWWDGQSLIEEKLAEQLAERLRAEGERLRDAAQVKS